MGIMSVTATTYTCDLCKRPLIENTRFVDAMVYGAAFHTECADPFKRFAKALSLDDITLKFLTSLGPNEFREKWIYTI